MKRFFILFLAIMALLPISSASARGASNTFIPLTVKNGDSVSICAGQYYEIELDSDSGKVMEWSSSDEDIFYVLSSRNDVIIASGIGSAYLNGKATDGSGEKVKVKISVPKVYTTHDKVVIDSPDGVEFGYAFNISGFLSVSHSGKCFTSESADDIGEVDMCKLVPVKVGTGSIVFTGNGRTIKTVKVEVKKSAFEPKKEEQAIPANGVAIAVVNKGVNIRSQANGESKKMGFADKGERLTVTQAFYSDKWHQILFDGETCYVSAKYCDIEYIEPEETPAPTEEPAEVVIETPVKLSESVEAELDYYIDRYRLTPECKSVIVEYLPDINDFYRIERDGNNSYHIVLNNGTIYCLNVFQNKNPACLQSSEKDYASRTRYFDYYAQFTKDGSVTTSYIGNEVTKTFHCDNCPFVISIKDSKKIEFSSRDEAVKKGYMSCVKCNP